MAENKNVNKTDKAKSVAETVKQVQKSSDKKVAKPANTGIKKEVNKVKKVKVNSAKPAKTTNAGIEKEVKKVNSAKTVKAESSVVADKKTMENAKNIKVKVVKKDVQKVANAIRERAEGVSNKAFNIDLKYEYINASNPKSLIVSAWSYLIFFLPLLICPKDKFARYHANQGLLVLLFSLISYAVAVGLYFVWSPLAIVLVPLIFLTSVIYITIGINNASEGRVERLPFIGKITIIKSV